MQQRCVPGRLGVDVEAEAIQELVVNSRQALSSQLLAPRAEPGPHRQAMLAGQRQCQVEDVAAPAIGQAMPVQVGGRGQRPPPAVRGIAKQREMDPERDLRMLAEQVHGVPRRRARHHQAARTGDPFHDRAQDRGVDRGVHPEVVAVHDEHAGIRRKAQQLARPSRGRDRRPPAGISCHAPSVTVARGNLQPLYRARPIVAPLQRLPSLHPSTTSAATLPPG